jgi:tetratricopeptide (TPR) repeat protein
VQNFGNHEHVTLPNSRLEVMIATQYYQNNGPQDRRAWITPEITAEVSPADYAAGRDPAMQAAIGYRPPIEVLAELIKGEPAARLAELFDQFKRRREYRYLDTEVVLGRLGYQEIRAHAPDRAVALFKIWTREHPRSANAFDSLADGYRASGDRAAAIEAYRAALKLMPDLQSSLDGLRALGAEPETTPR